MAFLISNNTKESISIPDGETSIGRGPFLKVADKRVSRSHSTIQFKDGRLSLKPVHKNPTFYQAAGETKYSALRKDEWNQLSHGDYISLLPNDLIFSVEITQDETQAYSIDENIQNKIPDASSVAIDLVDKQGARSSSHLPSTSAQNSSKPPSPDNTHCSPRKRRTLPSWMMQTESAEPKTKKKISKKTAPKAPKKVENTADNKEVTHEKGIAVGAAMNDEKEENKEEHVVVKGIVIDETNTNLSEEPKETSETAKPVCPYGAKCYRKNPAHFLEFSHSTEATNEKLGNEDDKPECEFGTSCYRKNAQHLRDYKHTIDIEPSKEVTTRKTRNAANKKKSVMDDRSDDDGEPNTYDYNDSFIDDDGDMSTSLESYDNDDDDSDFDPGGNKQIDDEEDIDELVSEAKEFINNDKS